MITDLSCFYLQDSWILGIRAAPSVLEIDLDIVLLPAHPEFTPPRPDEQYCYRLARLVFPEVASLTWSGQGQITPAVDASGTIDFGGFDLFEVEDDEYVMQGDFGLIGLRSPAAPFVLLEEAA